jgi:hypothetical protein
MIICYFLNPGRPGHATITPPVKEAIALAAADAWSSLANGGEAHVTAA